MHRWMSQLQEIVEKNQISLYTMKHGDMIHSTALGEMKCLFPIYEDQAAESENERSLVLRYAYGDTLFYLQEIWKQKKNCCWNEII